MPECCCLQLSRYLSLPMGEVWPMRDAERGVEAKGLVIVV